MPSKKLIEPLYSNQGEGTVSVCEISPIKLSNNRFFRNRLVIPNFIGNKPLIFISRIG